VATPLNPDFVASLTKKLGMTVTDDEIVHTVDVEDTTAVTPQAKAEADRVLAAMKGVAL